MTDQSYNIGFALALRANSLAVRTALADTRVWLASRDLDETFCSTVEIAVAEALNNVVEHAYHRRHEAGFSLVVRPFGDTLFIEIRDKGHPMPDNRVPDTPPPQPGDNRATLPEGGFGWHLIRSLADTLSYRREGEENCLVLGFAVPADRKQQERL